MFLKKFFSSILCAILFGLVLMPPSAYAAEADRGGAHKSFSPAHSIYIDKTMYTDGSRYMNPSVLEHVVKVGLCYGTDAISQARFENLGGGGFLLGQFDEQRNFVPLASVEENVVLVEYFSGEETSLAASALPSVGYMRLLSAEDDSVLFIGDESSLSLSLVPQGNSLTKFTGEFYNGGFECFLNTDGLLTVVNYVLLEDYVKGVIPYEMSAYWPFEALRAQAVCARTYAVYNIDGFLDMGFDVTDDTYSQVYRGRVYADHVTDSAVDTTAGLLVRYQGQVCEIYYFSADGGATEEGKNVFDTDRPYLAGKPDPFEDAVDFTLRSWSFEKSAEELSALLNARDYNIGLVVRVEPELSDTGNVIGLSYFDDQGKSVYIGGRRCYTMLGLHNCNFTVEKLEDSFVFSGSGWGHNCGLSQWGAYAMADVYGYDYEDIIRFYFTGAYVA